VSDMAKTRGNLTPGEIAATEVSEPFMQGMIARMVMSFYKYGFVAEGAPKIDLLDSLHKRLERYRETGNTEWLMDVANFAMIEFMFPKHPGAHFRGTDADESPGRTVRRTGAADHRNNDEVGKNHVSPMARFR
jgi:hypothetical protein